jgi:[CysO sulfur-carrier protein]-S-L-cysteine hydrolase
MLRCPFRLRVPRALLEEMINQAQAEFPNECCGLLAGTIGADGLARVERRYPLVNALASPTEYESEPRSMLAAEKDRRKHNLEFLAVYHSHPITAPVPSRKDRERNYMGEVMHFIIGLRDEPEVRGWWLTEDDHREAEWEVV